MILFCFKSVKSLRSLLYFMLSGVERIGHHLDFTETAELCYQMLKPVGAAPGKQVQVLKGLWEKCSSAQIEKLPRRLSQGSLSSNFRTSLSYFEQANVTQSLLCGECRENFGRNVLWLCLLWGSEEGAYTLHWQGSQAARWDQAQDGPGTPPTFHNNLPGSLSSSLYFSFLLALFLFPSHTISLSSSLYFFA